MKSIIYLLWFILPIIDGININQTGQLTGTVKDENEEAIIHAKIIASINGKSVDSTITDFDGNFNLTLAPGEYKIDVLYTGYSSYSINKIIIDSNTRPPLNITLKMVMLLDAIEITQFRVPLIETDKTTSDQTIKNSSRSHLRAKLGIHNKNTNKKIKSTNEVRPTYESYAKQTENDFKDVDHHPLSTFSLDVDRASYTNVKRFIENGQQPPEDAVRIEEMVNYFDYLYKEPTDDKPFETYTEIGPCPWNKDHELLLIGTKTKSIIAKNLPPANLVFLIDVSGSMDEPNKLPLVKTSLNILVDQMREQDLISIVVYAGSSGLALPPTSGKEKTKIKNTINLLESGGSTAGGAGIELAYKTVIENFKTNGNNRVILATDGDFNVGISNENDLERLIEDKRKSGVFLTCLGFGMGNYKDSKLEILADKGNGQYAYINDIKEAKKLFIHEFGGTLYTVAKDVKTQIEFNPKYVASYRLIGYENRLLNDEDFKDDTKDAGEIGAGHCVTILYEIINSKNKIPQERKIDPLKYQSSNKSTSFDNEYALIKYRYKKPNENKSMELVKPIVYDQSKTSSITDNMLLSSSVAMFGMILNNSKHLKHGSIKGVISLANQIKMNDEYKYIEEYKTLLQAYHSIVTR